MTTQKPAKGAPAKPVARKVAEGKIDHTACYAAKLHEATPGGRSLCRAVHAEGKPLTKASFSAAAKAKAAPKKQPAPRKHRETSSEDAMVSLSTRLPAEHEGDDPYDERDADA